MNIFILTVGSFPNGMAATNRLLSYAKGLIEIGNKVTVLIIAPDNDTVLQNYKMKGIYDGIHFLYTCKSLTWPSNSFLKFIFFFMGLYGAIKEMARTNISDPIHAIFIIYTSGIFILPVVAYAKFKRIKIFHERTEYPSVILHRSLLNRIVLSFYLTIVCPFFDGIFVISNALREYFISNKINQKKLFVFPMIVDTTRFSDVSMKTDSDEYIAYCGVMDGNKDGVDDLIEAFRLIEPKHPRIKLYLIGSAKPNEFFRIKEKILALHLDNRIILIGKKGRDEIPELLKNARLLVLARPDNEQAKGGFPTKLGEYLATGVPVVVTMVGEITSYLTDGQSAFLSEPDNPQKFADKMDYALSHPVLAEIVGSNGEELAHSEFNYLVQTRKLERFITLTLLND